MRERNLVPRSADAFLGGAEEEACGIVAATLGSLASSAALEGVRLDDGAGSDALGAGVAGEGVGADSSMAEAATRGSFCDFGEAGDEGERVAHAGSTLAVSGCSVGEEFLLGERDDADANGGCDEEAEVEE